MQSRNSRVPRHRGATQNEILDLLRRDGPKTAQELARSLGVTTVAVRKHLTTMAAEGLIFAEVRRQQLGRPAYVYHLTEAGAAYSPGNYRYLALELLQELCALQGEERVVRILRAHRRRLGRLPYKATSDAPALEDGYAPLLDDRTFLDLLQHICPIYEMARRYLETCPDDSEFSCYPPVPPMEGQERQGEPTL